MDARVQFVCRSKPDRLGGRGVVLGSSFSSFVSFATALIIILGWLFFRLNDDFRLVVLGWTLLVISSLLGKSASGEEAGHRDGY